MTSKSITYTATAPNGTVRTETAPATWTEVWFCFREAPTGGYFVTRHRTEKAARTGSAPNAIIGAWPRTAARGVRV